MPLRFSYREPHRLQLSKVVWWPMSLGLQFLISNWFEVLLGPLTRNKTRGNSNSRPGDPVPVNSRWFMRGFSIKWEKFKEFILEQILGKKKTGSDTTCYQILCIFSPQMTFSFIWITRIMNIICLAHLPGTVLITLLHCVLFNTHDFGGSLSY